MASRSLFLLSFLSFLCFAAAAPWIVTEYYEEIVTVYSDIYDNSRATVTNIQAIASATGVALSTATLTNSEAGAYGYEYDTVTEVQILYPSGAAIPTSASSFSSYAYDGYEESQYTSYVVALTFTAPAECTSSWAYTTAVPVYPPIPVKPTLASTSLYTDNSEPFRPSTMTAVYAYVDPTQVPASSLSALSESYSPYGCYYPEPTASSSSSSSPLSSGSGSGSSSGTTYCDIYDCNESSWINDTSVYGISPLAIILITVLGWTFVIFVAGLFENYFHFQRLMKGWQARRGLPITWWFWIFPVSCLVCLGFSRKGFQARTVEDAQVLRERWEEMGFWKKKRLWLRHGFSTGYPSMLLLGGSAPPRVGRPSPKPMQSAQVQPLLHVSPPDSAVPSEVPSARGSGDGSGDNNGDRAGVEPEMSGVLPSTLQVPSISATGRARPDNADNAEHAQSAENADAESGAEAEADMHHRPSSEILQERPHAM